MEYHEITYKDYLRTVQKRLHYRPEDKVIFLKVLYPSKKQWIRYEDAKKIDFNKASKVIIVFKTGNPMFVRTLDDEYAMRKVNLMKQKYHNKYYKKTRR